jgi:hypothetical protein
MSSHFPWQHHQVQLRLLEMLTASRANIARHAVEQGFLFIENLERDFEGVMSFDVVIRVPDNQLPSRMVGSSSWLRDKGTKGEEVITRTRKALSDVFTGYPLLRFREVRFQAAGPEELVALAEERAAARSLPVNNQANVHPESPPPIEYLALRFRSEPERLVWCAFMSELKAGESVAPLPVICMGEFKRIEPDFLLFTPLRRFALEIDGPLHRETLTDAERRTSPLESAGFIIRRVNANEVATPERAERWVRKILHEARYVEPTI